MAYKAQEESIDLGHPIIVLTNIALRTIAISVAGGSCLGLTWLFKITPLIIPLVVFFFGAGIFMAAYKTRGRQRQSLFIVTKWNHIIMLASGLVGGIWASLLLAGGCSLASSGIIPWLQSVPLDCGSQFLTLQRFMSATVAASMFLLGLPCLLALLFWGSPQGQRINRL